MGSTMAATGGQSTLNSMNTGKAKGMVRDGGMSSPFRETIARGMVTGVGLLGKNS